ncbi:MAG: acetolactate synthase, large subunit, biosynthetic type [Candidatus Omnitrophica bacterium CG11_big_fil_rev_8_21_14_0_20_64_10]|nr:MAG: acetolactate synthase, large subunit, biosynthetic type [Candidatus Omnitrophica bacterium CG11_big_fil_rev_8_21_14_0_20_64_10]
MKKMKGAQILVEALKREGVDVLFGYPGGANLPIYDALYDSDLKHILVRHEQGAAHMADGYARATGKVGVCLATSGPGATNLVTGIATAYMDSVPIVAITGQVRTYLIGNDAFQEADVCGITRPITKHNYLVKDVRDLARVIREAFHIAATGKPGPVLVDIPVDIAQAEHEFVWPEKVELRGYKPKRFEQGHPGQIDKAARLIVGAKKPVVYVGGGAVMSGATAELREFVDLIGAPVTTTCMALGIYPEDQPNSLRMLGMHGAAYTNYAVQYCDVLVNVGARFDDRVTGNVKTFSPNSKKIHIDIDPASIGKSVAVDVPIVGDVRKVLKELIAEIKRIKKKPDTAAWWKQIREWQQKHPLTYEKNSSGKLKPQFILETLSEVTGGDCLMTTDVGQHQMWACQFYRWTRPRTYITSGGLGTMGYGLPAAIGAQFGKPKERVVCLTGDGSFVMNIQELATAVDHKLPIKTVIINNGYLGMVRQWQEMFYKRRFSHSGIRPPDFAKVAEGFGAKGVTITRPEEVKPTLQKVLADDACWVVDCICDESEKVFPIIPPGKAIDEMIMDMA